jgi:hypothetical protein
MNKKEAEHLSDKIEAEGFDYCFLDYGTFDYIKDEKFHDLRRAFVKSQNDLKTYLESQDVEIGC